MASDPRIIKTYLKSFFANFLRFLGIDLFVFIKRTIYLVYLINDLCVLARAEPKTNCKKYFEELFSLNKLMNIQLCLV